MKNNIYVFNEKHLTIRRLQKEIELSKKKTQKINNDIYKVREEISVKENFIKKKTIENIRRSWCVVAFLFKEKPKNKKAT